jgi:hypothetical protein
VVEASAEGEDLATYILGREIFDVIRWGATDKSKMLPRGSPFRINADLPSPRVKGRNWNTGFGMDRRHRVISIRDREEQFEDWLDSLGVI